MDERLINVFQDEIKKQIQFAIFSLNGINDFFSDNERSIPIDLLWYYVQNLLTSSANVSKLLWGSNNKQKENRTKLRKSLGVYENSVLFSRTLRNDFEHYDERIETWFNESERKNFVDSNVGPTNMIAGIESKDFLRNFDTSKGAITFRGNVYEIQPLADELLKLNKKVKNITESRFL